MILKFKLDKMLRYEFTETVEIDNILNEFNTNSVDATRSNPIECINFFNEHGHTLFASNDGMGELYTYIDSDRIEDGVLDNMGIEGSIQLYIREKNLKQLSWK